MNKPIYDHCFAIIGHVLETRAVTFVLDREGKTAFFYNKFRDQTFDIRGQLLAEGNLAVDFLKTQNAPASSVRCIA